MPARPTRAAVGLLCGLGLLAAAGRADPDDGAKAAEAPQPDVSKLPNDGLLKHATALFHKASGDYLAAARALAGVEARLADASKQLADLTPPKDESGGKEAVNEDAAKAAVDAAKARAEFARRRLILAQTRKHLQEKAATAAEGLQSAAGAFQTALDDLKPFAVEIALRFQDGSMTGERPADLLPDAPEKRRKEHAAALGGIKDRLTAARKAVEATAKALDEAERAVSTADAEATEAGRVYAREQQRKETEK